MSNDLVEQLASLSQEEAQELLIRANELREEEEEMDPYNQVPKETLRALLNQAEGLVDGTCFEAEFDLSLKVSGVVVREGGEVRLDDCRVVATGACDPNVIECVESNLSEWIWEQPLDFNFAANAMNELEVAFQELQEELEAVEIDYDLPDGGLASQLEEHTGLNLD